MAKRVNSFSELFSAGPSKKPISEGLAEILPPCVLNSADASTPTVPEPEAPIQAADPPAQRVAAPKHRRVPRSKYTKAQKDALEAFFKIYSHPTKAQRERFAPKIELEEDQVYYWGSRNRERLGIKTDEQRIAELERINDELVSKNEELQLQNQKLFDALHSGICPSCGGPVPHSDVPRPRLEVVPPEPEPLIELSDDSIDMDHLRQNVRNLMPTPVERTSLSVPSDNLPGPAHDLVGVHTDLISDITRKAKDELRLMATTGFPLWISSPTPDTSIHPETLNRAEYLQVFQRGEPAPYFKAESSKHTATIQLLPITIVQILMNVGQWLPVFCSMVINAKTLEILSPGTEGSYNEQKQVMSAEFLVPSHTVSTREVQFVRYSHQQLDGSWIIVDVSTDELQSKPKPSVRSMCRKRPSGCLIRDLQNGSSLVTWVEHVDVREKEMKAIFEPFVLSGFAFGAKRWISTLQRQAERSMCATGIHTSPSDSIISPEGRRSLAEMANQMAVNFFNDISNSTYHHWTCSNRTRDTKMEVKTNKRRGDPSKPPGVNRTAGCSVLHLSHHTRIFEFLKDVQTRPIWDSMSMNNSVHVLTNFTTGLDPRNQISVLSMSNHNDFLILQECCTDATGSFVIYMPINHSIFQCLLCGVDPGPFPLMASGFTILPNVSGDTLDGTLLTMVFQISVMATSAKAAVESATCVVQDTLKRIRAAVN